MTALFNLSHEDALRVANSLISPKILVRFLGTSRSISKYRKVYRVETHPSSVDHTRLVVSDLMNDHWRWNAKTKAFERLHQASANGFYKLQQVLIFEGDGYTGPWRVVKIKDYITEVLNNPLEGPR